MSLAGWDANKKRKLVFDSALVDADLTDFVVPVLINATSGKTDFDMTAIFTELGINSKKIAFEIGDTGVQCYAEIVEWDNTGNKAHIEIKVPSVTAAADSVLHFYYDSAHADNTTYIGDTNSTPADTVHSGRVFVSHQAQDPSGTAPQILDSSPNAKHGTSYGTMTSGDLIDGLTGKAIDYDGTDDYTNHGYNVAHDITDVLTIRAVIKPSITLDNGLTNNPGIMTRFSDPTDAEDTYGLLINSGGRLHLGSQGGSIQSTKVSWAADTTFIVHATYNATGLIGDLYIDGVKETLAVDALDTMSGSTNNLVVGKNADSGEFFPGMIDEVVIINAVMSDAWVKADNAALRDNLITFSLTQVDVINALDQLYNLSLDPVLAALDQEYHLTSAVKNALSQVWANIIEQALTQYYGDADQVMVALEQYYHDAPQVLQALIQKYGDMVRTTAALEQQYNMLFSIETALDQKWAICDAQAIAGLVQEYDIRNRAEVLAALGQYWGLFRDRQDVQEPLFYVMADGVLLNPSEFSWTISGSAAAIECTITLLEQGVWRSLQQNGPLSIHWNGTTYQFFIEEKTRTRAISEKDFTAGYRLKGLTITAALEAPYALPITREWPQTTMASAIVAELAGIEGLEVDWRIKDFPVSGGKYVVNNQTPLTAIKSLVGSPTVDAVVNASPEGKLIIRREITTSPVKWKETVADHTIYDDGGVFSDSDDRDVMPGYNYIEISNEEETDSTKTLEQEDISDTEKIVRGYSVPWDDDFPLDTSGGEWVDIEDKGVKTSEITGELVEFVDGVGSLSNPFYDTDINGADYPLQVTWMQADLGSVTTREDGSLTSEVEGNSLAAVSYLTKYREWVVKDQDVESVQVYIPGDED